MARTRTKLDAAVLGVAGHRGRGRGRGSAAARRGRGRVGARRLGRGEGLASRAPRGVGSVVASARTAVVVGVRPWLSEGSVDSSSARAGLEQRAAAAMAFIARRSRVSIANGGWPRRPYPCPRVEHPQAGAGGALTSRLGAALPFRMWRRRPGRAERVLS